MRGAFLPGGGPALRSLMDKLSAAGETRAELDGLAAVQAPEAEARTEGLCAVAGEPRRLADGAPLSSASLLSAYRESGAQFLRELTGSFALAVFDAESRAALLAVDRMGVGRLAWSMVDGGLVFSSRADEVAAATGEGREIDPQRFYEFLFFHMLPSPGTAFNGVSKLPPAHYLEISGGTPRPERYWYPDFTADAAWNPAAGEARLHALLADAVREAASGPGVTGSFLSGGLDSSAISGYLSRGSHGSAGSFSIGFGVADFDELRFARETNRHFGIAGHEYTVTVDDIVNDFERIAAAYDEPFGNSSVVPTYHCARLAREHGVDCQLAGDGGDELFAGNERYAKQRVFELYGRLPTFLQHGLLEPLVARIGRDHPLTPVRKFRSYVDQASTPLPDRLEWWNYVYHEGLDKILAPEALEHIARDRPLEHMRSVYADTRAENTLNRMLAYDWRMTLADNDLRKVTAMCELAGVRVRFPLLDDAIVEFSSAIPVREKLRGTELRHFFRRAMQGFLPPLVLQKQKHGFGLPFGVWLKSESRLRDMIFSLLRDLGRTGVLREGFVDGLIVAQREGDAGFYGYFIWDLAMFQAWCRAHGATLRL